MKLYLRIKSALLAVYMALFPLGLCSCGEGSEEKYTEYLFDYFDTVSTVTGYEKSKDEFDEIVGRIRSEMDRYHRLFDIYNDYDGINNVKTLNDKAHGRENAIEVDQDIIELLELSMEAYTMTGGKVNVALGSVTSVWHKYRETSQNGEGRTPSQSELSDAAEHCDIDDVIILKEENKVYFTDPLLKLDVGAVAKGFATEKIARLLESEGISGYVLSLGGNVRAVGVSPNGDKWKVGVEDPDGSEAYPAMLELENEALVTSGGYRRFYTADGVSYHHIIDPETLFPSDRYKSVSVICDDAALGDVLSTALFNMSVEDGEKLISNLEEAGAFWIKSDGNMKMSSVFEKYVR